jgi:hypothetical protein
VGANSGPTTYRVHAFYPEREDVLTVLRVHAISGVMDFFDYSPAAAGMTYSNDLNPAGAVIDGDPTGDTILPGPFTWEMVTGSQGTLVMAFEITTDIPSFDYSSYYSDDSTPAVTQCTGDGAEYGSSGFLEQDPVPNTDPAVGEYHVFQAKRRIAYAGPNKSRAFAEDTAGELLTPLDVLADPYLPSTSGVDDVAARNAILRAGPNPFRESLRLELTLPESRSYGLEMFDIRGRRIWSHGPTHGSGTAVTVLEATSMAGGVYLLRLAVEGVGSRSIRVVHLP